MKKLSTLLVPLLVGVILIATVAAGATGALTYEKAADGAFKAAATFSDLKKNHAYYFSLNGWGKGTDGNALLGEKCGYSKDEGYCDFGPLTSDEAGRMKAELRYELPKGRYRVKALLKDPAEGWKTIWIDNNVSFTVH